MDHWTFIRISIIINHCCSLFGSFLSYWPIIPDSQTCSNSSLAEQPLIVGLDFLTSICWILYDLYDYPVSSPLMSTNFPPLIFQLLYFITFVYYRFRGSQFCRLALSTRIALGTLLLIFTVVGLLWICDVVSRICFAILAIVAGVLSSILTFVRLWHDPTPGNWKIIPRSILELASGAIGLFIGILQHDIFFVINSVLVIIFGLLQPGVAFFAHKNRNVPWFSRGTSHSSSIEPVERIV